MLVMSRREGDAILIGDDIEIVISHIGRSKVKVAIRAPREVPVIAREVKIVREQNLAAAAAAPSASVLKGLILRLKPASGAAPPENLRTSSCLDSQRDRDATGHCQGLGIRAPRKDPVVAGEDDPGETVAPAPEDCG
jgi:carbon storage regulator